jgi:hypothetical protein
MERDVHLEDGNEHSQTIIVFRKDVSNQRKKARDGNKITRSRMLVLRRAALT